MNLFRRARPADAETPPAVSDTAPVAVKGGATTTTTILRDLLIVTYAAPTERVRPLLPEGLPPDQLPGSEGELISFVQVVCAFHENARWSPLPGSAGSSFHQASYRILTRRDGRRGAFHWRTFVSASDTHAAKRTLDKQADFARFSFFIDGDPARRAYRRYTLRAIGDLGKTELEVGALPEPAPAPAPFGSLADMTDFLTRRDDHYLDTPLLKTRYSLVTQSHEPLTPTYATLVAAKLTPWTQAGVLLPGELLTPISVLLQPSLTLYARPPRFIKF